MKKFMSKAETQAIERRLHSMGREGSLFERRAFVGESNEQTMLRLGCPQHIIDSVNRRNEQFAVERRSRAYTNGLVQRGKAIAAAQERPLTGNELKAFRRTNVFDAF